MRQIIKHLCVALVAVATLGIVGCKPDPEPEPQGNITLEGTSWVGVYNDTYQGYPAELTWNLDFLTSNEGEMFLELVVAGQRQPDNSFTFSYTFDGTNGSIVSASGTSTFTYHPENNTITMFISAGDNTATMGGETTFYPRGTDPNPNPNPNPGDITEDFPAGTEWSYTENSSYHLDTMGMQLDLPMTIIYTLSFNSDHSGALGFNVNIEGQAEPSEQAMSFTWNYDESSTSGNIIIQGAPLPFTVDLDNNTLTWQANFSINGGQSVGGYMLFTRTR